MNILKFAAIDIGSNAIRLYLANFFEESATHFKTTFSKSAIFRVPIRLGEDVFLKNEISEKKLMKMILCMDAFKKLMDVYDVVDFRACATSAMREAKNGAEIIKSIEENTGVKIDVISGSEEAALLYQSQKLSMIKPGKKYLSVDLGGGSCEFTLFTSDETIISRSFNIGTVRLLKNQVSNDDFSTLKYWLHGIYQKYKPFKIIGSGGNINKIFRILESKNGQPIRYKQIKYLYDYMTSFSLEERMKILELNPDRADVIIPASVIFLKIMKWLKAEKIWVPIVGLSDGIVNQLYKDYKRKNSPI